MDDSTGHDTHQIKYVTATDIDHTRLQRAYQLVSWNDDDDVWYQHRFILPDAKTEAGEPVFLVIGGMGYRDIFPSPEADPAFRAKVANAASHRTPQLAYESAASDEFVNFYRVRSILRLKKFKDLPVFAFVD
jgi:hypothetical protein